MSSLSIDSVNSFREKFHGTIVTPINQYDEVRKVWNGMFGKHRTLIVRFLSTCELINTVTFTRNNDLLTTVRGGRHISAGNGTCDDGIIIDLEYKTVSMR